MNVVIHHVAGCNEGDRDIDGMGNPDQLPCGLEFERLILSRARRAVSLLGCCARGPSLAGGNQLDEICEEEMAWDEEVESQAKLYIGLAEVMTPNADKNSVLG